MPINDFVEQHIRSAVWIALPAAITLVYGVIMLAMNAKRKFDGPYPFFKVYQQTKPRQCFGWWP